MKAIILAGGSGSRLWPLSREMFPKQLIKIDDNLSLLQQTFLRLGSMSKAKDIVTVTNVQHYNDIKIQLNEIDINNVVISEPIGRNTAPAIACAVEYFKQNSSGDDIIIVLPSDHLIINKEDFIKTIKMAKPIAEQGYIVTFGIKPSYPETGYGYIKIADKLKKGYIVDKFVEKPDLKTAKDYVSSDKYYWNGGIFMAKASVFISEFKKYAQVIYEKAQKIDFKKEQTIPISMYENMPSISIDYAIMEKSDKIALVELISDWNDLGSWQSLYNVKDKDKKGNVVIGNVITDRVKNSFIYSQKDIVAVSGVKDIAIIETEDAIMACKMDKSQKVKDLYEILKKQSFDEIKKHKTIYKPWGYYKTLIKGEEYSTKLLCIKQNQTLQLHSHSKCSEHCFILEGQALFVLEDEKIKLNAGTGIDIPIGVKHSIKNISNAELKILEASNGNCVSNKDIILY